MLLYGEQDASILHLVRMVAEPFRKLWEFDGFSLCFCNRKRKITLCSRKKGILAYRLNLQELYLW